MKTFAISIKQTIYHIIIENLSLLNHLYKLPKFEESNANVG